MNGRKKRDKHVEKKNAAGEAKWVRSEFSC